MVKAYHEVEKKYPDFVNWLQKNFVHVVSKPRVMEAFWKWSAFSKLRHGLIFMPGMEPLLKLIPLSCEYEDGNPDADGKPKHGKLKKCSVGRTWGRDYINIAEPLAPLVADVIVRARNGKGKKEDRIILEEVEATILHEMIHWSYFVMDVEEKDQPGYGGPCLVWAKMAA